MNDDAGDILDEIYSVLCKHHCIMSARPEGFVLARLTEREGGTRVAEAIAIVGQISGDGIDYKRCGKQMRVSFR